MTDTPEKQVQDRLVELLQGAEADLRIDARTVFITSHIDMQVKTHRTPMVAVMRPVPIEDAEQSDSREALTISVPILIMDNVRTGPDGLPETKERCDRLYRTVRAALRAESITDPTLGLASLHFFYGLAQWDDGEWQAPDGFAGKALTLTATIQIEAAT